VPTKRSPDNRTARSRTAFESDLTKLRDSIQRIDADILDLVARRIVLARRIGRVKRDGDLPTQDFRIEKLVMGRNRRRAGQLGLAPGVADDLSRLLIEHAIRTQDEDRRTTPRKTVVRGERVLIVGGCGGMGRWLARFFDSLGHRVTLFDRASVQAPVEFPSAHDLDRAAQAHSVIVLATPIAVTAPILDRITDSARKALIFDVCSLKGPLLRSIRRGLAAGLRVASIHPLFGHDAEVLAGRNILLCQTPGEDHSREAGRFFAPTTANLVSIPIERHDEMMGCILGLSHLTNLVFARALAASGISYETLSAAGSTTFSAQAKVSRAVSAENQDLYFEIQSESAATPAVLRRFAKAFDSLATAIGAHDRRRFKAIMESTRAYFAPGDQPPRRTDAGRNAR
jgi:chorismate mutase / prephenate dehydrogenase